MMSYVKGTLSQGEEIKETVKLHWFNYLRSVFLGLVMFLLLVAYLIAPAKELIVLFVLILFGLLYDILTLCTMEMVVTNKRVVYRSRLDAHAKAPL